MSYVAYRMSALSKWYSDVRKRFFTALSSVQNDILSFKYTLFVRLKQVRHDKKRRFKDVSCSLVHYAFEKIIG
jgi:hypothetical protein